MDDITLLRSKYHAACYAVEHGGLTGRAYVWHVYKARGYRKFIMDYAMRMDDDDAMNLVLGAPHWLTYNDGTLDAMCHGGHE